MNAVVLDPKPNYLKELAKSNPCKECPFTSKYYQLRQERGYWKGQHGKAKERAEKLRQENEALKAKLRLREHQLFGRKSEQRSKSEKVNNGEKEQKRKRGQQPGAKGHGRVRHEHLPVIEEEYDLPEEGRCCQQCGLPYEEFEPTEDSEVIEIEVKAHRRRLRRKRYKRACKCPSQAAIVTAPAPDKLIPRGRFGVSFWARVLLDKYRWQRPTHRLLQEFETYGLHVSPGTVAGGLKQLAPLFEPLEQRIIAMNRSGNHWHADETRWMVFVEIPGKQGYRWYLWLFQSATTVVFRLAPSRGAKVPEEHFSAKSSGIISADRYIAYKVLIKTGRFLIAFCWTHVRRDFIDLARDYPSLETWALSWVEKIGELYFLNETRLQWRLGSEEFIEARPPPFLAQAASRTRLPRGPPRLL